MLRPSRKVEPDQWARTNRTYPPTSGFPGPRDPGFTPYMIPFERCVAARRYRKVVMVVSAQSGKTESFLDLIGHRLDQAPVPILYVGPSKQFLTEQFEHRIMQLLDEAPTIRAKVARGKRMTKTRKVIAGVQLRLAHAGSSTALKSDPVGLALTDEADEMLRNVRNQGDPIGLVDRRGDTYADFVHAIVSTPSRGIADVAKDEASGLEFWKEHEFADIESAIWRLWQQGTRYHWAWPCPHCWEYFIPRFSCLAWPEGASAAEALESTHMACPRCGGLIVEDQKAEMNSRGVYVAPGQWVEIDGTVHGDPPASSIASFWVSGLCSPFKTFGERASEFLEARHSGDSARLQVVVNGGFGELWAPTGGEAPEWTEIGKLRLPYQRGEVPEGVAWLSAGIDVQKNRLVYVVRGWGARQESWLIDEGELFGPTAEPEVWGDLVDLVERGFGGMPIRRAFIDSGFRPGKANSGDEHAVYEFCRRHSRWAFACKGYASRSKPLDTNRIDVTVRGVKAPGGLDLVRLDSDFFKSWVHERVRWAEGQPGGWHLHEDVTDEYCRQIVSEARARSASGKVQWIKRAPNNHFLDCFDPQTELLTDAGWMPVAEAVGYGGAFATVDLATDRLEYQPATGSVIRHHAGEMVRVKTRQVDLLVTPNHRMIATRSNPIDETPRVVLAQDLTIWHKIKKTATWEGRDPGPIVLPALSISIPQRGGMSEPERAIDPGDWFEFLGWYLGDGHRNARGRARQVVISKADAEKRARITALLERMGFAWRLSGCRQVVVQSRRLHEALADCYDPGDGRGSYRKRVPPMVKAGTPALIKRFIDAAIQADGWTQGECRTYATTSRALADDMQECFVKIGRCASLIEHDPPPHRIKGRSGPTSRQFHVVETRTKGALLRRSDNAALFKAEAYDGPVYCVTVPNGTLIARRNGRVCVVGNCEALAFAAAYMLGVQRLGDKPIRSTATAPGAHATPKGFVRQGGVSNFMR